MIGWWPGVLGSRGDGSGALFVTVMVGWWPRGPGVGGWTGGSFCLPFDWLVANGSLFTGARPYIKALAIKKMVATNVSIYQTG